MKIKLKFSLQQKKSSCTKSHWQKSRFRKLLYCLSRLKLYVLDTDYQRLHELSLALDFSEGELDNSYDPS